jgi:hypothetical protein
LVEKGVGAAVLANVGPPPNGVDCCELKAFGETEFGEPKGLCSWRREGVEPPPNGVVCVVFVEIPNGDGVGTVDPNGVPVDKGAVAVVPKGDGVGAAVPTLNGFVGWDAADV